MKDLTEKQKQVFDYICGCIENESCPPTVREIAAHFCVSPRAAQVHLDALRRKGFLTSSDKRSRSLRICSETAVSNTVPVGIRQIPLVGTVAAGRPILCEENYEGHVDLPESYLRSGCGYFALKVRGESMIDAGIMDGDTAIIERSETARSGQIVVAVIDDAITLKRFFREASRIRLQPENSAFNAIYCQDVRIVGILSCILRSY